MALRSSVSEITSKEYPGHKMTRAVEKQAEKVPSEVYLNLAFASIIGSLGVGAYSRNPALAAFIGLWAPTFMLLGIYEKITKGS